MKRNWKNVKNFVVKIKELVVVLKKPFVKWKINVEKLSIEIRSKLQIHLTKDVPVVSHNLTIYDYHIIILKMGNLKQSVSADHISLIQNSLHEKQNYFPEQVTSD